MARVPTFGLHQLNLSQQIETHRRLVETQMQVSSGKVSPDYIGVALDSRRLVNLETSLAETNGFIDNIDVTESRLSFMESNVSSAFDLASRFRELLVNALNVDNAPLLSLNVRAEDMIKELAGMLNVKQDNRHLFAGARTNVEPIDATILLSDQLPLVAASEFAGQATTSATGITGLTGIAGVKVESGSTGDAFQLTYNAGTQVFTFTNLAGGSTAQVALNGVPAAGQTKDLTFTLGTKRVVLTVDSTFNATNAITTATVTGNVDTGGSGVGAFGPISVTGTAGDISKINRNVIETSGTAASATLTLSSTDGNFVATGVDLSAIASNIPVTLTNATTGANVKLLVDVTTGLNDAAIASNVTEIRLGNFLETVAVSNGAVNTKEARPGDPGYDSTKPSFYKGDSGKLTARIDIKSTVDYGITAGEAGFEKLFRALYMARIANVEEGNVDRTSLEAALGLVVEAIEEIPDIRSRIGSDRRALEETKIRHEDFVVFTKNAISQIEDVDLAEAISRLSFEETQLEASFSLTARLAQLSLANFLR